MGDTSCGMQDAASRGSRSPCVNVFTRQRTFLAGHASGICASRGVDSRRGLREPRTAPAQASTTPRPPQRRLAFLILIVATPRRRLPDPVARVATPHRRLPDHVARVATPHWRLPDSAARVATSIRRSPTTRRHLRPARRAAVVLEMKSFSRMGETLPPSREFPYVGIPTAPMAHAMLEGLSAETRGSSTGCDRSVMKPGGLKENSRGLSEARAIPPASPSVATNPKQSLRT